MRNIRVFRSRLSHTPYSDKDAPTVKNLQTIWDYFKIMAEPSLPPYYTHNTILVDDSFDKGALQPLNHIGVGEYDFSQHRSDLAASALSARLPQDPRVSYDVTLLALIGILEELKNEPNVRKWIQECRPVHRDRNPDCDKQTAALPATWFKDKSIMDHWAEKGKVIAGRLGIEVEPGIRYVLTIMQ